MGVVVILCNGFFNWVIGLRVDMDVLDFLELNSFDYKFIVDGKMYVCGYDGYIIMLLGVVWYFLEIWLFDGMVYFIF